eukprot:Gb_39401 [translate_table: standard]
MAAALGLKCTSLCWVPVQSAVLDPPRSSSSPIQSAGTISVWRISSHGSFSLSPFAVKKLENHGSRKLTGSVKVASNEGGIVEMEEFGDPVSLGTMKLPTNVDLKKLEALLFQWGNSLTQSANVPLPVPLKVDKVKGGIRLGFVRVNEGKVEDLVHIDCLVSPSTEGSSATFRALRNGQLKNETPPGEPIIMQSLLQALRKSIDLART